MAELIDERFTPYVVTDKAGKPATVAFYQCCTGNLKADKTLRSLQLDAISAEHVTGVVKARRSTAIESTTLNRDLAMLWRILNLSEEWEVIETARGIKLLPG